ncbi:RNA polymerase sigma factor [Mucilaginibacter paludis]|uniref:RNA polymerase, sigma-24 subunit, ECF subfamily n=1 Tax=Mucilaginibacter paludis DSM 18603 TaxID=714943 RepID=H1Y3F8_9SPHI|nr:RNA polymerase sigma-70 factor [Mucilaginibacter paludis]EHQ29726.1 RNA polymerase, sigma-24 subunit, ECF subfamily [Mucilaginibacter paludis DSM 18603]
MSTYRSLSDPELVDLLKSGDQAAFTEIYDRYWSIMYAHAYKMIKNREEAKDLIQEIFSTLWLKSHLLTEDTNVSGYLYTAARNRVFNLMSQHKTRHDYFNAIARFATEESTATIEHLEERDLEAAVEREIQLLPPKMREIFELSRKQNLSHKEIAEQLNLSDQTVKKQVQNALKILKPRLRDAGTGIAILLFFR